MNRVLLLVLVGIAVVLVIGLLALPTKEKCPKGLCVTAPDAQGNIHYYYEVKPLGAALIENITGTNLPFHYTSGDDFEKVR